MVNDSISDMLTRLRNASSAKKPTVNVPSTRLNTQIAKILEKEGFIQTFQPSTEVNTMVIRLKYRSKEVYNAKKKEACMTNLRRLSKPGLRLYSSHRDIPRILGGTGIIIMSTVEGIMTDREARARRIGGELLCSVW